MLYEEIQRLLEEVKNESELSDTKLQCQPIDQNIPEDISSIQNKYDLIISDLREMKENIQERIRIVEKTELIMNLLQYRMYEIRYDFTMKFNQLTQQRNELKTGMMLKETESQAAFKIIETEKEIAECQNTYDAQHRCVKEQMLEAQARYEKSVNILDNGLEVMKKNFSNLLLLLEAEKAIMEEKQFSLEDVKNFIAMENVEAVMERFTEMQTEGWKTRAVDNVSGYSYIPLDRLFGQIEKVIKKSPEITSPEHYMKIIEKWRSIYKLGVNVPVQDWKSKVQIVMKPTAQWHFELQVSKRIIISKTETSF
ncbi:unnamed protein product [Acanthoscelides obtectus]|uniref:Uncharacterized protein n=1 Tax=Acanthoscelides obtectus TaxID=200917 RepID=A0A9P0MAC4_ACAOB|nr:unnamed protein product [Acanthoscelides obtectus]CAK1681767.1 hypothetical protein AOBTE_LOCUS33262 [Acanthoscelides obtectus]